jgi:hypothetical protein
MIALQHFESEVSLAGCKLPVRSTLVREGASAILIAPVRFSEEQFAQMEREGGVTDLVASSLFHHLFFQKAAERFPNAKRWGVAGFDKKRPDIAWSKMINEETWPYANSLPVSELQGAPAVNEAVFFHKSSKTLIVTDLCFNLTNPCGWSAPFIFRIFGTYKRFAMSRLYRSCVKDKNAFNNSLRKVLQLNFQRIVMAHGEIIESNAKELLQAALRGRGLL